MDGVISFYLKWLRIGGTTELENKALLENFVQDFILAEKMSKLNSNIIDYDNIPNTRLLSDRVENEDNISTWIGDLLECGKWRNVIMKCFDENPELNRMKVLVSYIYDKEGMKLTQPSIVCSRSDIFIETILDLIADTFKTGSATNLAEIASYSPFSYLCVQCILKHILPKIGLIPKSFAPILYSVYTEIHEYTKNTYQDCYLYELDFVLNSVYNQNNDDELVSTIYFDILKNNCISLESLNTLVDYSKYHYQEYIKNNATNGCLILLNSLFYDICCNRSLSKQLIVNLFTKLEKFDRENHYYVQMIQMLSLIVISNNIFDIQMEDKTIISRENQTPANSSYKLEDINEYLFETLTILKKLNESELNITRFEDVSKILENPIKISSIAYGFMVWFQHNLEMKNFSDATAITTMPFFFFYLDTIVNLHLQLLHQEIVSILKSILFMSFDHVDALTEFKLKKKCMSSILFLMIHEDMMIPVYEIISAYKDSFTDTSLLFYFIRKFLKIIQPPFSVEFKKLWGPFLNSNDIQNGLRSNERESLHFFLKHMA